MVEVKKVKAPNSSFVGIDMIDEEEFDAIIEKNKEKT